MRRPNRMEDRALLKRVEPNPRVMAGKAVIQGTRLTVEHILNLFAYGETVDRIRAEYGGVSREDILVCVLFAAKTLGLPTSAPLATETG